MQLKNVIDITDGIISRFLCNADKSRLDINIVIGIICRLTFFILLILFRDIDEFTIGELIAWLAAWFVQHIHILCFEKHYIILGESRVLRREIEYKIMGSLQLLIGIIYLSLNLKSYIEILILTLFSINLLLNFFLIFKKSQIKEGYIQNYQKQGGSLQCYIGFLFGAVGVIIIFSYFGPILQGEYQFDYFLINYFLLTIIGQIILVVQSFIGFYRHGSNFEWSKDWAKGILGYYYGVQVGIFSIFYGFIIGVVLFILLIWELCYSNTGREEKEKQEKGGQETEQL